MALNLVRGQLKKFRRLIRRSLLFQSQSEAVFSRIYAKNRWGSHESRSGQGSEISYTENLRRELPQLITDFQIKRLLDAPCGDFNWMNYVVSNMEIKYIGGDIVKKLIRRNIRTYESSNISFRHIDITRDLLPSSDLMIVRDCLFHFSYADIHLFLENFCRSEIGLLLTTTHICAKGENSDISTGGWRKIYLFAHPFRFPAEPLRRIEDYIPPHSRREMCLFDKGQVETALRALSRNLRA